jgi:hypothetical protein
MICIYHLSPYLYLNQNLKLNTIINNIKIILDYIPKRVIGFYVIYTLIMVVPPLEIVIVYVSLQFLLL